MLLFKQCQEYVMQLDDIPLPSIGYQNDLGVQYNVHQTIEVACAELTNNTSVC